MILKFKNKPAIVSSASAVGKREWEGPLGSRFDFHDDTDTFGQNTWEKSESESGRIALNLALSKEKSAPDTLDALYAGDLINQCISSSNGLLEFDIPYFGIFGACSTSAEGLILASMSVDGGYFKRAGVVTSSHNLTAERQFRNPVEYGGQRTPTSQWTVTGAGAFIIEKRKGFPVIAEALPGITQDSGISDPNNMGAAMAPAAADTLERYFNESGKKPGDFDCVVTGDLGFEGYKLLNELLSRRGIELNDKYRDCGLLIFDREAQDMHSGGSGCGCGASVLSSYFLQKFADGELHDILYMATGALMNPMSVQQGNTITGIAHLVRIKAGE